ncbi:MAG: transposase [Desulfobacterales bacterium]|nr:transposase [Desulfobacterales bacterium]
MPRHKRINVPGAIHHVITRGLNRQKIFPGDKDREDFLSRLEKALSQTSCHCLAWSLQSDHFHLLIRTDTKPLGDLMRKVLSGYAIAFNRRHQRSGYLFQNRYKSILCQEDAYLLELVRYIHLNPVRAGIVKNIEELGVYRWTGHGVLVGRRRRSWQDRDGVLGHFAEKKREAVNRYRQFVSDGFNMGKRKELTGGGLVRSAGGWQSLLEMRRAKAYWRGDERILGDSDFVGNVLQEAEEELSRKEELKRQGWDLQRLVNEVCRLLAVDVDDLQKKGRANNISMAKGVICYLGYYELGINGAELARFFNISRPSVSKAIQRGDKFIKNNDLKVLS